MCVLASCAAGPSGGPDGGDTGDAGQQASGFPDDVLVSSGLAVDDTEVFFGRKEGAGINLYARKVDGTAERLLGYAASESVRSLVVSGDTLYYVNRVSGLNRVVSSIPRAGGGYANLTDTLYGADAVTVDATHLYVAHYGSQQDPKFTISRRTLGATATAVDTVGTNATPPAGNVQTLLVDASRAYAAIQNDPNLYAASIPGPGAMSVMPLTNGRPAIDEGLNGLALAAGKLFMTAFDDLENFHYAIYAVDTNGGSPQAIVSGRNRVTDVVADADHVWWIEQDADGTYGVYAAAHDGTGVASVGGGIKDAYWLRQNSTALFLLSNDVDAQKTTILKFAK